MVCERYEAILRDGAGPTLIPALEAHVRECPGCAGKPPEGHPLLVAMATSVEQALRVEPSADFLSRVRRQVAEERARPSTHPWRWRSGWAASIAIAVALFAAIRQRPAVEDGGRGPTPSARVDATPPSAAVTAPPAPRPEALPDRSRSVRTPAPRAKREPALPGGVLVEEGQAEALARLAASAVHAYRARPAFVVASFDPEAPLPRLETADLPRFDMTRLEPAAQWSPERDAGSPALETNERE